MALEDDPVVMPFSGIVASITIPLPVTITVGAEGDLAVHVDLANLTEADGRIGDLADSGWFPDHVTVLVAAREV